MFVIKKCCEKCYFCVLKLFRIHDDPFELRTRKLLTIIGVILSCIAIIGFSLLRFITYFEEKIIADMIIGFVDFGFGVVYVINLIAFIIHQRLEILLFFWALSTGICMGFVHVVVGRGFNSICLIFLCLLAFYSIVLDSKLDLLYTFISLMIVVGFNVYDIIDVPEIDTPRTSLITYLAGTMISWLIAITMLYLKNKQNKGNAILLEKVAEAVNTLNMDSEAIMKLKKRTPHNSTKVLLEFQKIVDNVQLYKSYLPDSLQYDDNALVHTPEIKEENLKEIKSIESIESIVSVESCSSAISSHSTSSLKNKRGFFKRSSSGSLLTNSHNKRKNQAELFEKKICYLILYVLDFKEISNTLPKEEIVEIHSKFIEIVSNAARQYKGVMDYFGVFKVKISFNTVKKIINYSLNACKCGYEIMKNMKEFNFNEITDNKLEHLSVKITISDGKGFCGNIGSKFHKSFCVFGDVVEKNKIMIKKVKDYCKYSIVIDKNVRDMVRFDFRCKIIDFLDDKEVDIIYAITGKVFIDNSKEWMYNVHQFKDETEEEKIKCVFDEAWKSYINADYAKAKVLIHSYMLNKSDVIDEDVNFLINRMKKRCLM